MTQDYTVQINKSSSYPIVAPQNPTIPNQTWHLGTRVNTTPGVLPELTNLNYLNVEVDEISSTVLTTNTGFGTSDADTVFTIVRCLGNLTINSGITVTAAARKLGLMLYVQGDLILNGTNTTGATITMSARGANHNGTTVSGFTSVYPGRNIRVFNGGYYPVSLDALTFSVTLNATNINVTDNTILIPNHGLVTGQEIRVTGSVPTGLTANQHYFVIKVDDNKIQVASSYANATSTTPVPIDITGTSSGTMSVSYVKVNKSSVLSQNINLGNSGGGGGESSQNLGTDGSAGSIGTCGGGGSGSMYNVSGEIPLRAGNGAAGTTFSGGSGGGGRGQSSTTISNFNLSRHDASPNGGAGGEGSAYYQGAFSTGGSGNLAGVGGLAGQANYTASMSNSGTGGCLVIVVSGTLFIRGVSTISSNGSNSIGGNTGGSGGSSGGGSITILAGNYMISPQYAFLVNGGTAAGGSGGSLRGGNGGMGSIQLGGFV